MWKWCVTLCEETPSCSRVSGPLGSCTRMTETYLGTIWWGLLSHIPLVCCRLLTSSQISFMGRDEGWEEEGRAVISSYLISREWAGTHCKTGLRASRLLNYKLCRTGIYAYRWTETRGKKNPPYVRKVILWVIFFLFCSYCHDIIYAKTFKKLKNRDKTKFSQQDFFQRLYFCQLSLVNKHFFSSESGETGLAQPSWLEASGKFGNKRCRGWAS